MATLPMRKALFKGLLRVWLDLGGLIAGGGGVGGRETHVSNSPNGRFGSAPWSKSI